MNIFWHQPFKTNEKQGNVHTVQRQLNSQISEGDLTFIM